MAWVPLHVHSQYSILDSSASIEALAEKAKQLRMSALALTDQGNMYGAVEFFKACQAVGAKPIVGCELYVAPASRKEKKKIPGMPHGFPLILLAKSKKGFQNLCRLSSLAHLEGFYYTPRIDKELLQAHAEDLVCLSGSIEGVLPQWILQGKQEELHAEIQWFQKLFQEDFYFELQRHGMSEGQLQRDGIEKEAWLLKRYQNYIESQDKVNSALRVLGAQYGIRTVATNDTHYLEPEDWRAHEILMNIQSGEPCEIWEKDSFGNPKVRVSNPRRHVADSHERYFKSQEQMQELFSECPEALEESVRIAEKCHFAFDFKTRFYPVFVPPHLEGKECTAKERTRAAEEYLRTLCEEGIGKRYTAEPLRKVAEKYPGKDPLDVVRERLHYELSVITPKGMCDYLLIVWDFINWAKNAGIPVGPGRGSGAGSIILYLIGVTDIEPLRFNLFFERFINPERISYPDIDVDICMERRSEVIDYTLRKYGKERVAQIITFGTMKAKMAIKDVGRVLSVPLPRVNAIAKLVPEDPTMTLDRALEIDPELSSQYQNDPEVRELIDLARKLEGSVRNTGIHAAGIIICGDPLILHIPICAPKDSDMAVTQFSMKPVESVGMLKIDLLGLKTLTSIQRTVNALYAKEGKEIDWINLPLDDQKTFDLLNQGKTMGIFQLESGGMQELAKQLHIDRFEEIVAVGALYRPGPMEMIPSFVSRKHGREPIDIDHPLMQDILAETYGIMVYQEQVMQIASRLAGYTLGEGDVLRRAMGKKDREEMAKQREKFRAGALKNGIHEEIAMRVFDKIEKFASYGFNKSHAAAYGYLTYVTAYLKAHFPAEWMAALMTSDRDDISKVAKMIRECQTEGIAILPPSINESGKEFVAVSSVLGRGVRFALTAIKGVGEGVVDSILQEKEKGGQYKDLYDFITRIDTKKVGKKVIEYLIEAGCFDFTGWSRQALVLSVEPMFDAASKEQKEASLGVISLFSLIEEGKEERFSSPPEVKEPISKQILLKREYELLGFYLGGHPLDDYRPLMQKLSCVSLGELEKFDAAAVFRSAFIIEGVTLKISSKSQKKFAILQISDGVGRFELPIWPELYEEKSALLTEGQLVYAVLQLERQEGDVKLQCRWLDNLTSASGSMVQACDAAFDRAKVQTKAQRPFSKPDRSRENKEERSKEMTQCLHVHLDADQAHLSHILEIKKIFRACSGAHPVHLLLMREGKKVGELHIDKSWGVEHTSLLEQRLQSLTSVEKVQWQPL